MVWPVNVVTGPTRTGRRARQQVAQIAGPILSPGPSVKVTIPRPRLGRTPLRNRSESPAASLRLTALLPRLGTMSPRRRSSCVKPKAGCSPDPAGAKSGIAPLDRASEIERRLPPTSPFPVVAAVPGSGLHQFTILLGGRPARSRSPVAEKARSRDLRRRTTLGHVDDHGTLDLLHDRHAFPALQIVEDDQAIEVAFDGLVDAINSLSSSQAAPIALVERRVTPL